MKQREWENLKRPFEHIYETQCFQLEDILSNIYFKEINWKIA